MERALVLRTGRMDIMTPMPDESAGWWLASSRLVDEMAFADALTVSAAFAVAGFVHGITGFGAGMTAMAIAPISLPLIDAVAIVAVYVLIVCVTLAYMHRDSLSNPAVQSALIPLCAGSVLGVPLGVSLLTHVDPRWLKILLGASMLAFVLERLIHECRQPMSPRARSPVPRGSRVGTPSPARFPLPAGEPFPAGEPLSTGEPKQPHRMGNVQDGMEQWLLPAGTRTSTMADENVPEDDVPIFLSLSPTMLASQALAQPRVAAGTEAARVKADEEAAPSPDFPSSITSSPWGSFESLSAHRNHVLVQEEQGVPGLGSLRVVHVSTPTMASSSPLSYWGNEIEEEEVRPHDTCPTTPAPRPSPWP